MTSWSAGVVAAYRGSGRPAVINGGRIVTGSGLLAIAAGTADWLEPDAVYATGSPIHHIGGLGNVLVALSAGAATVATASFGIEWWRGLAVHGVTHVLLVPSMMECCWRRGHWTRCQCAP
jgi:acyl-coenzyme A synthetase/AMP-(fatty) acid ligase